MQLVKDKNKIKYNRKREEVVEEEKEVLQVHTAIIRLPSPPQAP
jgi:hypothetical protein